MKTLLILFPSSLFLVACKKENVSSLHGKWEIRRSTAEGRPPFDYAPGSGSLYEFSDENYVCTNRLYPQLSHHGTYTLVQDTLVFENIIGTRIIFSYNGDDPFLQLKEDSLVFKYQHRGATVETLVRIR